MSAEDGYTGLGGPTSCFPHLLLCNDLSCLIQEFPDLLVLTNMMRASE